jgi:hypothetical protein
MRILLDEDVPAQVQEVLAHVLRGHIVNHVVALGWSGKKDLRLFADAIGKFEALVTNNYRQLQDPDETRAIKKSGLHHISYPHRGHGLPGLALCVGAIIAAMPLIIQDLDNADGQRIVSIKGLGGSPSARYTIIDPRRDPPEYWPR